MIFHIKVNNKEYEVQEMSTVDAIKLALDQYIADISESPNQLDIAFDTQPITVSGEFAGEKLEVST